MQSNLPLRCSGSWLIDTQEICQLTNNWQHNDLNRELYNNTIGGQDQTFSTNFIAWLFLIVGDVETWLVCRKKTHTSHIRYPEFSWCPVKDEKPASRTFDLRYSFISLSNWEERDSFDNAPTFVFVSPGNVKRVFYFLAFFTNKKVKLSQKCTLKKGLKNYRSNRLHAAHPQQTEVNLFLYVVMEIFNR